MPQQLAHSSNWNSPPQKQVILTTTKFPKISGSSAARQLGTVKSGAHNSSTTQVHMEFVGIEAHCLGGQKAVKDAEPHVRSKFGFDLSHRTIDVLAKGLQIKAAHAPSVQPLICPLITVLSLQGGHHKPPAGQHLIGYGVPPDLPVESWVWTVKVKMFASWKLQSTKASISEASFPSTNGSNNACPNKQQKGMSTPERYILGKTL